MKKYYFSASIRTDGSSRFQKDNRWGTFWSVGANWRISQEKFMQNLTWISNLSAKNQLW
ncbi:TonB-dependent receptor [Phocaeicola vulgatus]|nr:TonB-dependent receptor [Phocaeicola vulgatus]